MKIEFQSTITRLGENKFGVAVTAVVTTAQDAIEVRRWLDAAVKEAAGKNKLQKGSNLILPDNWANGR